MISLTVLERSSFNINLWSFYIRTFVEAKQVRSRPGQFGAFSNIQSLYKFIVEHEENPSFSDKKNLLC